MNPPKNLRLKSVLNVPIYDVTVWLYVSHDAARTYRQVYKRRGFLPDTNGFQAMTCSDDNKTFALFFHITDLTSNLIAHEVSHLTRMLLKHLGVVPCSVCDNDELDSLLSGYLTEWVNKKLKAARIRVL